MAYYIVTRYNENSEVESVSYINDEERLKKWIQRSCISRAFIDPETGKFIEHGIVNDEYIDKIKNDFIWKDVPLDINNGFTFLREYKHTTFVYAPKPYVLRYYKIEPFEFSDDLFFTGENLNK